MSLVGQALMMVVARCIRGRTAAGAAVLEQPVEPIVEVLRRSDGAGKPTIAVYVESSESEPTGLETQAGAVETIIKVIAYTPPSWRFVQSGEGTEVVFENEGTVFGLNLLARQADVALHTGNDVWVAILRRMAKHIDSIKTRYALIEVEDGVRIPAIERSYCFKRTVNEPEIGVPLFGAWADLDAALRADEDEEAADIIKGLIENPAGLLDYQHFQMARNLSKSAFITTGMSPVEKDGAFMVDPDTAEMPKIETVDAAPDHIDIVTPGLSDAHD